MCGMDFRGKVFLWKDRKQWFRIESGSEVVAPPPSLEVAREAMTPGREDWAQRERHCSLEKKIEWVGSSRKQTEHGRAVLIKWAYILSQNQEQEEGGQLEASISHGTLVSSFYYILLGSDSWSPAWDIQGGDDLGHCRCSFAAVGDVCSSKNDALGKRAFLQCWHSFLRIHAS